MSGNISNYNAFNAVYAHEAYRCKKITQAERAFHEAVQAGDDQQVETLLDEGCISDEQVALGMSNAIYYGKTKIIQQILNKKSSTGDIFGLTLPKGYGNRESFIGSAANHGSVEILYLLLGNNTIPPAMREHIILTAASAGNLHMVEEFLTEGVISIPARDSIVNAILDKIAPEQEEEHSHFMWNNTKEDDFEEIDFGNDNNPHFETKKEEDAKANQDTSVYDTSDYELTEFMAEKETLEEHNGGGPSGSAKEKQEQPAYDNSYTHAWFGRSVTLHPNTEAPHLSVLRMVLKNGEISPECRQKAMKRAAGAGNLLVLKEVLKTQESTAEDRGVTAWYAANKGKTQIAVEVLRGNASIDKQNRFQAFWQATAKGHFRIVQALLLNDPTMDENEKTSLINNAIRIGRMDIMQELIDKTAPLNEVERGSAVASAASKGRLDMIRVLLKDNAPIDKVGRGNAVENAASSGRLDIVQELLKDNEPICEKKLGQAVVNAFHATLRYPNEPARLTILQDLLKQKSPIDQKKLGEAVLEATKKGRLDLLEELLKDNRPIDGENLFDAITYAERTKSTDILITLFKQRANLTSHGRGEAIACFIKYGRAGEIDELLKNNATMDEEGFGKALAIAVQQKDGIDLVQKLIRYSPKVLGTYVGEALRNATNLNRLDIVQEILRIKKIPGKDLGDCIANAIRGLRVNTPTILEQLLKYDSASGTIELGQALLNAVSQLLLNQALSDQMSLELIQKLFEKESAVFNKKMYGMSVMSATKSGRLDILQELLKHNATNYIDHTMLGELMVCAATNQHWNILQELLKIDRLIFSDALQGVLKGVVGRVGGDIGAGLIKELRKRGAILSGEELGDQVYSATRQGDLVVIQALLEGNPWIANQKLIDAVELAVRYNIVAILKELLKNNQRIPNAQLQQLFNAALQDQKWDILEELLKHNPKISTETVVQLLDNAAFNGRLGIIQELLKNNRRLPYAACLNALAQANSIASALSQAPYSGGRASKGKIVQELLLNIFDTSRSLTNLEIGDVEKLPFFAQALQENPILRAKVHLCKKAYLEADQEIEKLIKDPTLLLSALRYEDLSTYIYDRFGDAINAEAETTGWSDAEKIRMLPFLKPEEIHAVIARIPAEEQESLVNKTVDKAIPIALNDTYEQFAVKEALIQFANNLLRNLGTAGTTEDDDRAIALEARDLLSEISLIALSIAFTDKEVQKVFKYYLQIMTPGQIKVCLSQLPPEEFVIFIQSFLPTAQAKLLTCARQDQIQAWLDAEALLPKDAENAFGQVQIWNGMDELPAEEIQNIQNHKVQLEREIDTLLGGYSALKRLLDNDELQFKNTNLKTAILSQITKASAKLQLFTTGINALQGKLNSLPQIEIDEKYLCPISMEFIADPIYLAFAPRVRKAEDTSNKPLPPLPVGHLYDRDSLTSWLNNVSSSTSHQALAVRVRSLELKAPAERLVFNGIIGVPDAVRNDLFSAACGHNQTAAALALISNGANITDDAEIDYLLAVKVLDQAVDNLRASYLAGFLTMLHTYKLSHTEADLAAIELKVQNRIQSITNTAAVPT